ncbi:Nucleolar Complex 2 protein, partial [Ceratobasidium sp. 423]
MDLAQLQKNDPEFYKYLQENDRELLDFNPDDMEFEEDEDMEESDEKPVLTSEILKSWQRSLIETHSLRTLRKLLVAFKAAAYMNDEDVETRWRIDNAAELALSETGKLVPWVVGSRKAVKMWLKTYLSLWSTSADSVRISAFLAVRKLSLSADEAVVELVMKNTYLTLLRSSKSTSAHTLPSLTLMKNSASELFRQQAGGYTVAFGYIRQLAVHLRASTRVKTKEAYKQVYNWQFVHCVDFWSLVLARGEEELQPLVYPLVQVGLGAVSLIPSQRYHPLHLHILTSLHHLATHTKTYIPISSHLLPILTSYLSTTSKPKSTMLKPLDLASTIRAPSAYLKTRVLAESIVQEAVWLLAESVPSNSVAFPEVVFPIISTLKKSLKKTSSASGKVVQGVKSLIEHLEEHSKWTTEQRKNIQFGPERWEEVGRWEEEKGQGGPLERTMADDRHSGEITARQSGEGDVDRKSVGDIEKTPSQTNPESQSQYLTGTKLALAFIGMLLSILLVALDQTIVVGGYNAATALPKIASHFDALSQVSWIVSGYFLTQAGLLLLYGQLLIVAPTKWIYVAAVLIFEIGSLFCAVAPSAEFLIFGRA